MKHQIFITNNESDVWQSLKRTDILILEMEELLYISTHRVGYILWKITPFSKFAYNHCPSCSQREMLKGFSGDKTQLGSAEKFLLALVSIPG